MANNIKVINISPKRKLENYFYALRKGFSDKQLEKLKNYDKSYVPYLKGDSKFTPIWTLPNSTVLYDELVNVVRRAKLMIIAYSFIIEKSKLITEIENAAKKRRVPNIKFMTTIQNKDLISEDEEELLAKKHMSQVNFLQRIGIEIRSRTDCHIKVILTENEAAITSANFVINSLTRNPEYGFIIRDEDVRAQLAVFLRELWDNCHYHADYDAPEIIDGKTRGRNETDLTRQHTKDSYSLPDPVNQNKYNAELTWTFVNDHRMNKVLLDMINNSQNSIDCFTYYFKENSTYDVGNALVQAAKHGIKIRAFSRALNSRQNHLEAVRQLMSFKKNSVEFRGDLYNHSKGIIVDSKKAMIFTGNFDPLGLQKGIEIGVYSEEEHFVKEVENWFTFLFNNSSHEIREDLTLKDFKEAYIPSFRIPKLRTVPDLDIPLKLLISATNVDTNILHETLTSFEKEPIFIYADDNLSRIILCSSQFGINLWKKEDYYTIEDVVSAKIQSGMYSRYRRKATSLLYSGTISYDPSIFEN